jgi:hypothetical protein
MDKRQEWMETPSSTNDGTSYLLRIHSVLFEDKNEISKVGIKVLVCQV